MSEDEWVLSQLIMRDDCKEPILKKFKQESDEIRQYSHLNRCDTNVLAMILSYVELNDIFSCMNTCRQWYQASKKKHFWKRHIDKQARNVTIPFKREVFHKFDTFSHPDQCETLREQVEWLFKIGWITIGKAGTRDQGYIDPHVTRYTYKLTALTCIFNADLNVNKIRYYSVTAIGQLTANGFDTWWYPLTNYGLLYSHFDARGAGTIGKVMYRYKDGETVNVELVAPQDGSILRWIDEEMEKRRLIVS